jgi:hypothetical protein
MGKTHARVELEQCLGALEDLEAKRAGGQLDRLHYLLKRNYMLSLLIDRSWTAWRAINDSVEHLKMLPIVDRETSMRLKLLRNADPEAFRVWRGRFIRANIGPIAHKFLDLYEAVQVVEVPELPESRYAHG